MKIALIFFFAVVSEVTATTALKFSEGFTKLIPSLVVVAGYGLSFYLLSLSLKVIPIGTAYALWSGIGIVLTVIIGAVLWREQMDWARGIGSSGSSKREDGARYNNFANVSPRV